MQKLCKSEALSGPKNLYKTIKVIKTAHRRSHFSNTFVSQEILAGIGLRKNLFCNSQNFGPGKFYLQF